MSTTEVESVVSKAGGLVDCVVYGVEVLLNSHIICIAFILRQSHCSFDNTSLIKQYLFSNFKVSNSDGRAGMAAVAGEVDIELLAKVRSVAFTRQQ